MKELKISGGMIYHIHPAEDVDEYIRLGLELHKELGFDGVDFGFRLVDRMGDDWRPHMELALKRAEALGLRFAVAHLPFVAQKTGLPEGDGYARRVYRAIDAVKFSGAEYAVLHPNSTSVPLRGYDQQAEYENVVSFMAPFAEYAHKVGVNMVIENMRVVHGSEPMHRFAAAPDELCRVADALDIGVCWDTGHAHITGLKQSEALAYVGKRLKMIHLNDNFAGDDIHLAPFCGTVDWADVMQALSALDFAGYLNFEVSPGRMPADVRKTFGRHIITIGHELLKMM